jgi:hypothetical protein
MSRSRVFLAAVILGAVYGSAPTTAHAWSDPFNAWNASGYLELLQIDRPSGGLPPTGFLDDQSQAADGYTRDGVWGRSLDVRLSGPLGYPGWSAALESATNFDTTTVADAFVRVQGAWGAWTLGQCYLPFGAEQQVSKADLVTIQRSLVYGFENYGHLQPWGLELVNQRGIGLRWDDFWGLPGGAILSAQAGTFGFSGGEYLNAEGGLGRLNAEWGRGVFRVQAAWSLLGARAGWALQDGAYAPLGAAQDAPFIVAAAPTGKGLMRAWGPDASMQFGVLHVHAEWAAESLEGGLRGGGQWTAFAAPAQWLSGQGLAKAWSDWRPYVRFDQAFTSFADGMHAPNAPIKAQVLGLQMPTGWDAANLKWEYVLLRCDASGGVIPDGRIFQVQAQIRM